MNIKFVDTDRKGVKMTEVWFNNKMVYIVMPHDNDPAFVVVDPFMSIPSKPFTSFDEASAFAAAFITGSYYD